MEMEAGFWMGQQRSGDGHGKGDRDGDRNGAG